ncbi:carbon monoxide dehydrogenase subunit G [Stappia stellulata]|uniref:SRPBCC family protein n=1 Tax=Stappia stellulata TaxID=71235 RepID=UPI001CD2821B|nr:carbon monoxide dehydrogenase subunit G [Stappia stellulata]MCA1244852.1 carbon monoxide dehydrogenase subunit G [Stappia stellulata]
MDLSGEYRIRASRAAVWDALNDPDVLRRCIPGCKELEKSSDTEMSATVVAKIGPVKATFKGAVTLENLNPPESYTIVGEGKGGVAGFAKGAADVSLAEDGEETVLTYEVKAQVGGKLAQLGSRLIVSTSRKMADEFFSSFKDIVEGDAGTSDAAPAEPAPAEPVPAPAEPAPFRAAGEPVAGPDETAVAPTPAPAPAEQAPDTAAPAAKEERSFASSVSEAAHDVEERVEKAMHEVETEVETAAGRGAFGGPMVWGLIALAAVIVILAVMS